MASRISKFEDTSETQKTKYFAFFKTFFFCSNEKILITDQCSASYRNQSLDSLCKSFDWFL